MALTSRLALVVLSILSFGGPLAFGQEDDPVKKRREELYSGDEKRQTIATHELLLLPEGKGLEEISRILVEEKERSDVLVAILQTIAVDPDGQKVVAADEGGQILYPAITALSDSRPSVAAAAERLFFAVRDSKDVRDRLLRRWDDESLETSQRIASMGAAGHMKSLQLIEPLIERLGGARDERAQAIAEALGRITFQDFGTDTQGWRDWWFGDPGKGVPGQKETWTGRTREEYLERELVRRRRAEIVELEEKLAREILELLDSSDFEQLQHALSNSLWPVRAEAAESLGLIQEDKAVPVLLDALQKETRIEVQKQIVKALGTLGKADAVRPLVDLLEATVAARDSKPDFSPDEHGLVVLLLQALGELRDPGASGVAARIALDRAFDKEIRAEAAKMLGLVGGDEAGKVLCRLAAEEKEVDILLAVLNALGQVRAAEALELLIGLLDHEDPRVRCAAADALGMIKGPRIVEPLLERLAKADPVARVRVAIVTALGQAKAKEADGPVAKVLAEDTDSSVRTAAAEALGEIGSTDSIPALAAALSDPDGGVGEGAWVALRAIVGTDRGFVKRAATEIVNDGARLHRAVELLRWLLVNAPPEDVGPLTLDLAQALGRLGEPEVAHGELGKILASRPATDPSFWPAKLLDVELLARSGKEDDARAAMRGLAEQPGFADWADRVRDLEARIGDLVKHSAADRVQRLLERADLEDQERADRIQAAGPPALRALEGPLDSKDALLEARAAGVLAKLVPDSGYESAKPLAEQPAVLAKWREWLRKQP